MQNKYFKHISRRQFVKNSAVVAGGLMAGALTVQAGAYAAGQDEIRIALIGCGGRGTGAAVQALMSGQRVKLVAMADAFRDRLDESYGHIVSYIAEAGIDKEVVSVPEQNKFVGFDAYSKAADLADVVLLATPPGFRPIHFDYAIRQGKHVFMEKPVATDAPGIRKVLEAGEVAREKKLNVVVGLQRRYQNNYLEMINRVHAGEIGDLISAQAYWNSAGVWVKDREPDQTEMEYQMRNWYYFNWLCGDHIVEQHVHNLDVVNWAKQAFPVSARGFGGRQVRTGPRFGQIFDHHFVEFTYSDGVIMNSQCRHIDGCWNKVDEALIGTKGKADGKGTIYDLKGNVVWKHRGFDDPDPYQTEHDELFAAIANNEYKFNDTEHGAKSTLTAIMGRMATYSGQEVTWEQAMSSTLNIMPEKYAWDAPPPVLPDEHGLYPVPVPGETTAF